MTGPEVRPNRRIGDTRGADSPRNRQRHIVRVIAADPVLVDWLGSLLAKHMDNAAQHLELRGHAAAATDLRNVASGYRSGRVTPF